ncbi:hypothetical protein OSSY52_22600 [Tepiditoga spiralis]|uniref:Haloacid dehalogenase n=1 Tax=Tepiditoga spiralis TaxID=2108365 RepID=A0A7G1GCC1_9BACT|nr:HAD family hydrolase [Tepiditoga spiralis]BBE32119.1 hypothetical protein OSSY52_22600 [Tepiditoga spiralis]
MIKGIIFDLYGTLIDASSLFKKVAFELSDETNIDPLIIENRIYELYDDIFKNYYLNEFKSERYYYGKLFKKLKEEISFISSIEEIIDFMYESFSKLPLYADVTYLNELRQNGYKIIILSNADSSFVKEGLINNRLFYNELIISEEVKFYKPSKEIFDIALSKSNLRTSEVLFVGDNLDTDIKGGVNAGIKSILIDRDNKYKYALKIKNLYELKKYME